MKDFWGFYDNGQYKVGCNGRTMYLYDAQNHELAKFRDIPYAYRGAFKPGSNIFVLRSTEGCIAIYDCDERKLLHKFRFSDVTYSQDDGFCFSPDGAYFLNIERIESGFYSRLSVYETQTFSPVKRLFAEDKSIALNHIEYDPSTMQYNALFFTQNESGVYRQGYVGVLKGEQITQLQPISSKTHRFLNSYKSLQSYGFTKKAMEWSDLHYAGYTNEEIAKFRDMNIDLFSYIPDQNTGDQTFYLTPTDS